MPKELIRVPNWSLGIWSSSQAEEIPDQAAQNIENLEFDADDNLISRVGAQAFLGDTYPNRITSSFRAQFNNGTVYILYTSGNQLYRANEDGTGVTNITGSLTLPNDEYWMWTMFGDFAIGVNRATSGDNPVKVNSSGVASALGGSPPKAKYLKVWNSRLWLVGAAAANQNTVYASALGLPEDWTVDDAAGAIVINVDSGDGDQITGLEEFRESLIVFKKKKINIVSAVTPVTDPDNLRVDIYTRNIGCISPYSIQPVLDDVLFLSSSGVASLAQSQYGELKTAILSFHVAELSRLKKNTDEIPAIVLDDMNQYWISIPKGTSPRGVAEVYVFDYSKVAQGIQRWTRFTGRVAGTAYTERLDGDYKKYLIAYDDSDGDDESTIYQYDPTNPTKVFNDVGLAYSKILKTKAYSADIPLLRKEWFRWGLGIRLLTDMLGLNVRYTFNNANDQGETYSLNFLFDSGTSLWDFAIFDTDLFETVFAQDVTIWRKVKSGTIGKRSFLITFEISNQTVDQAFILKNLAIEHSVLGGSRSRVSYQ